MGSLHYFLGLEILQEPHSVIITHRKFAIDLLKEAGCFDAPTNTVTPLSMNEKLTPSDGILLSDPKYYRKLVEKLDFMTHTRPEIAFAVQFLSQFMQSPREPHLQAIFHVFKYISQNPAQGLFMAKDNNFTLEAFCDSDWGSCKHSRRSVSGYFIMPGNSPISWKSKKQPTISSTSAAEYRALRRIVSEIAWLTRLLHES